MYALQMILGHASLDMTPKYVRLLQSNLHMQHEKCSTVESLLAYVNSNGKDTKTWTRSASVEAIK